LRLATSSAGVYESDDVIVAAPANNLMTLIVLDVTLPLVIGNHEHLGPQHSALGTYIWIEDERDTPLFIKYLRPPLFD
jgi:hypothetical protein